MISFFSYLLCFGLGASVILFCVKRRPTFKHKKEVIELQKEVSELETKNTNLHNRNTNLVEIIHDNQQDIKDLKEAVATLSRQVILNLELLSSVTRIRGQVDDINSEIIITKRVQKKYAPFLNDSEIYRSN